MRIESCEAVRESGRVPVVPVARLEEVHTQGDPMRKMKLWTLFAAPAMLVFAFAVAGCDRDANKGTTGDKGGGTPPQQAEKPKPATQPIIPVAAAADWCREHGVPESVCTRCNESLIPAFKAKGDWDEQHKLPKSQCFECDPSLKQKFAAAYKEKYGKEPPAGGEDKHDQDKR
jgi:hypothetical protein